MPLTESDMTHADMQNAVNEGYLCAVCQGRLSVAWLNGWILRCCNDINHTGITRHDIKYENKKKEHLSMDSTALTTMDESKMMVRVEMARFPQELTLPEKKLLAQVAITYGFDPLMGEVTIYQGKPYVSIDGRYRKAQETNKLDGVESRPASKQERTDWQISEGDYFFRAEVRVIGASMPFVGWGRVFQSETVGGKGFKPVEKNPQRMAEKRAEAQALRKAFHINLPSIEDIGSPEEDTAVKVIEVKAKEEKPAAEVPTSNEAKKQVVINNQAQRVHAEVRTTTDKPQEGQGTAGTVKRDALSIKTLNEMVRACHEDFKMQPKEVLAELNVKSIQEIEMTPAECYVQIATVRQ
ncbi:MAG: hypothetical protein IMZ53_16785 [Thermoplasmata archaeon]|nr:hypothetical protein [Thermoplasmata archaeon]